MGSYLLLAATLVFLLNFGATLYAFGAGRFRPGRVNLVATVTGFVLLSWDLWLRGQAVRGCPINTLHDILIFMSWAVVLIYIVVGTAYRLSLLGSFTSALVLVLLLFASLLPGARSGVLTHFARDPWIEGHAALSLVAYGAFALAALAGLMYRLQDRELKHRKGGTLLYNLPPITDLATANVRLLWLGFGLLTISFASGFVSRMPVNSTKFWASAAIWAVYGILLLLRKARHLPPRRMALLSVAVFVAAMGALPAIQHLSTAR